MRIIYEPKGRAREYSPLACNLYIGCSHGCKYCFAPRCMHTTNETWKKTVRIRENVLSNLEKDAFKLHGDPRTILFSFLSDPYQPIEQTERLTHNALEIIRKNSLRSQILTKGDYYLIKEDFDLMKENDTQLGITISFIDDEKRKEWEPEAATVESRLKTLREAFNYGIFTWVSLEPVIDPKQALAVIQEAYKYVNFWKVGKLNHMKKEEEAVDWKTFLVEVTSLLNKKNAKYYIKNDLKAFEEK